MTVEALTAIGSLLAPFLVLLLSGVGWALKNRLQRTSEREVELRTDRMQVYNDILEPFVLALTKETGLQGADQFAGSNKNDIILDMIMSLDYRQTAFKLALVASDDVL